MITSYVHEIVRGTGSLLAGMKVTIKAMLSRTQTVQWPRQYLTLPQRFRGHIQLVPVESTGFPKCFACGNCARTCPSKCITVKGKKPEGAKKKAPTTFLLDFTKCSLCGLCVESCPVSALSFSKDYAMAGPSRQDFAEMDLLPSLASPFSTQASKEKDHG